ncbi:kinesin-like protein KIF16B [Leptidea sinapis]|uniref:kinesin-like protein KIF16B n=1 Tax=Leptidea sinapis TaxID=189913 RepID=UPI0021C46671|nr:kinesin-like protein KIF16B [Leptidea sinapis]
MSNIKLGIRVRPFTDKELKGTKEPTSVIKIVDENTVSLTNFKVSLSGAGDSRQRVRRYHAHYTFDSSGPPHHPSYASQQKVFDTIGREVLHSVLNGLSACVLAYGQSATGKTFTMMGTETNPGLIPQLCLAFSEMKPLDIKVSYLEIYNEKVHDLLSPEDLRVREHPTQGPYVQSDEKAGAERYGECRLKEGANINKSLVAFSNVVSALVNNNGRRNRFVPYRDSVLTWLLRDCFTGGANTFVIATVSPSEVCYSETASTLRWAASALKLPNKPYIPTSADTKAAIQIQYNRADIIASVTERLYSKLKRKEDTSYKIENAVEKKIVQPLNELKICTNARQRLMEISQKALRNKRKIV